MSEEALYAKYEVLVEYGKLMSDVFNMRVDELLMQHNNFKKLEMSEAAEECLSRVDEVKMIYDLLSKETTNFKYY